MKAKLAKAKPIQATPNDPKNSHSKTTTANAKSYLRFLIRMKEQENELR